jgi:ATP-dependent Clp protease adaptor protein ClpS
MVSLGFGTMDVVSTAPAELDQPVTESEVKTDAPWITLVWNDPVNLMTYVSFVFQEYFGYDRAKADVLMMQVHQEGRAVVSNGSREEMERDVAAMHGYGLWATLQQDT